MQPSREAVGLQNHGWPVCDCRSDHRRGIFNQCYDYLIGLALRKRIATTKWMGLGMMLTTYPGASSCSYVVDCEDDQTSQGNRDCYSRPWCFVSPTLDIYFEDTGLIGALSASIATLIRLKFLADLTDTDDILCMCPGNFYLTSY